MYGYLRFVLSIYRPRILAPTTARGSYFRIKGATLHIQDSFQDVGTHLQVKFIQYLARLNEVDTADGKANVRLVLPSQAHASLTAAWYLGSRFMPFWRPIGRWFLRIEVDPIPPELLHPTFPS